MNAQKMCFEKIEKVKSQVKELSAMLKKMEKVNENKMLDYGDAGDIGTTSLYLEDILTFMKSNPNTK